MAPRRIERIALRYFRGATTATELELDAKKPVVLIFGENGSGKSTIIDAIDMVCNKSAGSLASRASTNLRQHVPAAGRKTTDVAIELTCGGATWKARFGGRNIVVEGPADPPVAHILRRAQLLRLIEAKPAERFDELRRFIDVSGVEGSEQALRGAERAAQQRLNDAIQRNQAAEETLRRFWEDEGRPGGATAGAIVWAAAKVAADMTAAQATLDRLSRFLEQLDSASQAADTAAAAELERSTKQAVLADGEVALTAARLDGSPDGQLADLLRAVRRYLGDHAVPACPVCEQPIATETLRATLDERLTALAELTTLQDWLTSARGDANQADNYLARCRRSQILAARDLLDTVTDPESAQLLGGALNSDVYPQLTDEAAGIDEAAAAAVRLLDTLTARREELSRRRDALQKDIHQYNAFRQIIGQLQEADHQVRDEHALQQRLKKAYQIVHDRRILFTQRILDEVATECSRLYQKIHPGEPIGLAAFRLDEKTRGSLHQFARFQNHEDVPPQAYFSESHLDTLGFCLFLALTKRTGDETIVVLDDVFTSVDASHLGRIADLLIEECAGRAQIILTTHQRNWRNYFHKGRALEARSCVIDLTRWSFQAGIRHTRSRHPIEDLEAVLEATPFDRQAVASKAGVLLESLLDGLALVYACRLPRQAEPEYDLGTLLDGVGDVFKKLRIKKYDRDPAGDVVLVEKIENGALRGLYQEICDLKYIRNQVGAHNNQAGDSVPDPVIEQFGQLAVRLHDVLTCTLCGERPKTEREDHRSCPCRGIRMWPRMR